MSKIIRFVASNFKRLKAVEIEPGDNPVVVIRGENEQGKSSCLDAIAAVLGGERLCPKVPVRRGTNGAVVRVELPDVVIERRWAANGESTLRMTTRDGLPVRKPQTRLDDMMGRFSFDPLAFMDLEPKRQAETLRNLVGLDFAALDGRRQTAYDLRTEANRQVMRLRTQIAAIPEVEAPDEFVSSADLLGEQQRRSDIHTTNAHKRMNLDGVRAQFRHAVEEVEQIKKEIAALQANLEVVEGHREELRQQGAALKAEVEQLVNPDMQEIPAKLRELEATNDRVRAKKARTDFTRDLVQAETKAIKLSEEIEAIDQEKAAQLTAAKFPVPGLTFSDDGVLLDGLPFEQGSQSKRLRVSVAIGAALNPELRAMLVRDGSRLDKKALALLKEEAARLGVQVWLEMVGKDGEGIVIEDGEVESATEPK